MTKRSRGDPETRRCTHTRLLACLLLATFAMPTIAMPAMLASMSPARADTSRPIRVVAFGDSLTAGYMLKPSEAFPVRLEAALKARGHDVVVANAGVSGDTTAAGLGRIDWAVPDGTDGVILELGANDALSGRDPAMARANLDQIVIRLKAKGAEVLIAGMAAPRNMGEAYVKAFDPIYPDLAARHDTLLYPFFLAGVVLDPKLNLGDGIHPNAQGVDVIVARITPSVEQLLARIAARRAARAR